ncbi:Fc.00g072310.m01.CDS01 [Cosmosporella sp. VM-42]
MDLEELELHSKWLQETARYADDQRVPFSSIKLEYHDLLERAIKCILATELAFFAYV